MSPETQVSCTAQTISQPPPPGVSFVIPVHNGERWFAEVLAAIQAQSCPGPVEIIAVEDGSTDASREMLERHARAGELRLVDGPRRGASAALNAGIRAAAYPLIAQVDQDVVLEPGWLEQLTSALGDAQVAAAQGHYIAAPNAGPWSRVMGLDLRQRYSKLRDERTNHVCTGNSVYRKAALIEVGLFDETLGYGNDNDISYRLAQAGYRLAFCPDARSTHHWREGLMDYARQQYGFGYGRLDLVAKHRQRMGGDDVSRIAMMMHAPVLGAALLAALAAIVMAALGFSSAVPALVAVVLLGALVAERLVAGIRAAAEFRDPAGLLFVPMHLVRDLAWVIAIVLWCARRLRGAKPQPSDSMRPREPSVP